MLLYIPLGGARGQANFKFNISQNSGHLQSWCLWQCCLVGQGLTVNGPLVSKFCHKEAQVTHLQNYGNECFFFRKAIKKL